MLLRKSIFLLSKAIFPIAKVIRQPFTCDASGQQWLEIHYRGLTTVESPLQMGKIAFESRKIDDKTVVNLEIPTMTWNCREKRRKTFNFFTNQKRSI